MKNKHEIEKYINHSGMTLRPMKNVKWFVTCLMLKDKDLCLKSTKDHTVKIVHEENLKKDEFNMGVNETDSQKQNVFENKTREDLNKKLEEDLSHRNISEFAHYVPNEA